MKADIFEQFEGQFGKEWSCSCGGEFESSWVEVVSKTKSSILAKYTCQICGLEQMFAVSVDWNQSITEAPLIQIPKGTIGSNDVLDIKNEISKISPQQIKNLYKKKINRYQPAPKTSRE